MGVMLRRPYSLPLPTPLPVTVQLADRLLARVPELALTLRDALLDKDEVYATSELVSPEDLLLSCQQNMLRSLQSLAGRVPEGVDLMDAARATASRRADSGFPLESLLHAFRIGTEVLWAGLLEEARAHAPESLGELLAGAVQVMQLMDVMSMAAADEYRVRESETHRRDAERRHAVVDSLLEGRGADPTVAAEAMRVLELPSEARLVVVVVEHTTASFFRPHSPRTALQAHGFPSEWRLRSDREVGLVALGSAPLERLVARLRPLVQGTAGVSGVVRGVGEVGIALRMAELAQASLSEGARSDVVTFDDRLPEALLASNPLVTGRLRESALGGLAGIGADKREVLIQTLDLWFRLDRSAADVADALHCHRNTVWHRLSKIEALTGRRLNNSRDELLLRLALLAP